MKISKVLLSGIVFYALLLFFCMLNGFELFVLAVVLFPISCGFLYISIKRGHVILSVFSLFFLVSHALNPIAFFYNRDYYDVDGWNAVKDFDFTLPWFFRIYSSVFLLMSIVVVTTLLLRVLVERISGGRDLNRNLFDFSVVKRMSAKGSARKSWILILLLMFLIPVNVYMFLNRIGMTGITPPELPFHLSGILFYFRVALVPVLIFYLYAGSGKSNGVAVPVILVAILTGFCGTSKSALILGALPVLFFDMIGRRFLRLVSMSLVVGLFVQLVSIWKGVAYFYHGDMWTLSGVLENTELSDTFEVRAIVEYLMSITNSFFGSQGVVLASQHDLADPYRSIVNFLSARPILEDMASELFGLNLVGTTFGVAIGLIATLLLLSGNSLILLVLSGIFISLCLSVCEFIISKHIRMFRDTMFYYLAMPMAFLVVSILYSGEIGKFATVVSFLFVFLGMEWFYKKYLSRDV